MTFASRHFPYLVTGLAVALLAGADEDANWRRLRSMPREQRVMLSKKLEEFDRLSRDEQARVRALDEKLAALAPADRANYNAVLRRYHLWLGTLTESQRSALSAAAPEQRLALAAKFRAEQGSALGLAVNPLLFQLADLRGRSPFEVARMLEIWFALSPEQRAVVEKQPVPQRLRKLNELGREVKVKPLDHLTKKQEDAALKRMEGSLTRGFLRNPLRKQEEGKSIADRRRLANNYHFLVNPPRPVSAANLFRFESAMPPWFRTTFDHLPPDEAKRRLTILYRLLYPAPQEMPATPARAQGKTGAKAPPAPAGPPGAVAPPPI